MKKIRNLYIFTNGMCLVSDENGEQIPSLQGKWVECFSAIFTLCDADTIIYDARAL